MTTYLSPHIGRRVVRLVIGCFIAILFVVGYTFWSGYEGRQDLVEAQREGCKRAKLDRAANARAWRAIDQQLPWAENPFGEIATELEARSNINCNKEFPDASLVP